MKSLQEWFCEYEVSHQNVTNKKIHYICVPAIYFSIIGIVFNVKISFLNLNIPIIENLAFVVLLLVLLFYFKISTSMGLKMTLFSVLCLFLNFYLSNFVNLLYFSIILFVIAWIGQFYGHKIEGKKPSFLKDLQFLMIGPAWVIENMFSKSKS